MITWSKRVLRLSLVTWKRSNSAYGLSPQIERNNQTNTFSIIFKEASYWKSCFKSYVDIAKEPWNKVIRPPSMRHNPKNVHELIDNLCKFASHNEFHNSLFHSMRNLESKECHMVWKLKCYSFKNYWQFFLNVQGAV